jgi:hypothetical protein
MDMKILYQPAFSHRLCGSRSKSAAALNESAEQLGAASGVHSTVSALRICIFSLLKDKGGSRQNTRRPGIPPTTDKRCYQQAAPSDSWLPSSRR